MSVFSGLVPTVKLGSSEINSFVYGLGTNVVDYGASVALSPTLGEQLSNALGVNPNPQSNFLGSLVTQGVPSAGINAVTQAISNSLTGSRALGSFAPIAGGIAQGVLTSLGNDLTNSLFGDLAGSSQSGNSSPSLFFPGAGGDGEGDANYSQIGNGTRSSVYSVGNGGPDVVFSITPASASVKLEEYRNLFTNASPITGFKLGELYNSSSVSAALNKAAAEGAASVSPSAPITPTAATATTAAAATTTTAAAATATSQATTAATATTGVTGQQFGTPEYFSKIGDANLFSQSRALDTTLVGVPGISGAEAIGLSTNMPIEGVDYKSWKFICPPEEISWETTVQTDRVNIFGANQAPVISGVKGMRDLNMNNAVVEGFTRSKTVEDKIIVLEDLLNMSLSSDKRYVQVPVYRITAENKVYGQGSGDMGFFIIKSVKVQEKMRDLSGRATRATVDISFIQVPNYQVDSGRDVASKFLASQKAPFTKIQEAVLAQQKSLNAQAQQAAATGQGQGGGGSGAPASATPGSGGAPQLPGLGALRPPE